jgi:hypothetical protein
MSAVAGDEHPEELATSLKQGNGVAHHETTEEASPASKDTSEQPIIETEPAVALALTTDEITQHTPTTTAEATQEEEQIPTAEPAKTTTEVSNPRLCGQLMLIVASLGRPCSRSQQRVGR